MTAERVEQRLTAILAADVAGYSRLMGADEEGTLAQLKAHRRELIDPKITEHRGRIVKTTGDGMLVEFAAWWMPYAVLSRSSAGWPTRVSRSGLFVQRLAGPRKPGVQTYSSSEPCTRVASNSVTTVTPGTGFSTTSTICGGGPGALMRAFFVTARFALVLVTRFLGVVLAATRFGVFVLAARLGALPRFSVAFRPTPRFFR